MHTYVNRVLLPNNSGFVDLNIQMPLRVSPRGPTLRDSEVLVLVESNVQQFPATLLVNR